MGSNIFWICFWNFLNHCTLHIRVVISFFLDFHFLVLICSLCYKNHGNSLKRWYLYIKVHFRGKSLNPVWSSGGKKWHFHTVKWRYWPGCLSTVDLCCLDIPITKKLPTNRYFDISKAPAASSCLEKLFDIAYNSYISKCSRITSKPNLIYFSEQFY